MARSETIICAGDGLWRYTGTHWVSLSDHQAAQQLLEILSSRGWPQQQGRITITAKQAVESLKQQTFSDDPVVLREGQPVINCTNGELWFLQDGSVELRPHDPLSGLTHAPQVEYDPAAKCPAFSRALIGMFTPPFDEWAALDQAGRRNAQGEAREMARHVEEVMAYLLVPDRWMAVWFLLIGSGANGKTKIVEIVEMLLPSDAVVSERLNNVAANQHGMARLIGKTLYVDNDLRTGIVLPDDFLKKISEGKHLSANVKHCPKDVVFYNRCGVVTLSNNYPKLIDLSIGTRRRLHVIEFSRRFYLSHELAQMSDTQREKAARDAANINLGHDLRQELPGILNRLVRAYSRLKQRGDFDTPNAVRVATKTAVIMANPLAAFIDEECTIGPNLFVIRREFQWRLDSWNIEQRNQWHPTPQQLRKQMEDLGHKLGRKRDGERVVEAYLGVGFRGMSNIRLVQNDVDTDNKTKSPNRRFHPASSG